MVTLGPPGRVTGGLEVVETSPVATARLTMRVLEGLTAPLRIFLAVTAPRRMSSVRTLPFPRRATAEPPRARKSASRATACAEVGLHLRALSIIPFIPPWLRIPRAPALKHLAAWGARHALRTFPQRESVTPPDVQAGGRA